MSRKLHKFQTVAEYQAYSASTDYITPCVAVVEENNVIYYDYGNNQPHPNHTDYKVSSKSLVSDGGDTYGRNEKLCLNYIPSGVTSLESAFSGWTSLEEVTCKIPDGVTSMSHAFEGCTSLKEVTFLHTTPQYYDDTLYGCSSLETIYVPDSAVSAYKTATGWSQFASKIKPLSEKPSE